MPFALKIQWATGIEGQDPSENPDYRGGEPKDEHRTLQIPGVGGLEIDPVDDSELPEYMILAKQLNELFGSKLKLPVGRIEARIMDSDGRR